MFNYFESVVGPYFSTLLGAYKGVSLATGRLAQVIEGARKKEATFPGRAEGTVFGPGRKIDVLQNSKKIKNCVPLDPRKMISGQAYGWILLDLRTGRPRLFT
ncbi:hypothetical protein KY289_018311 [Solanum tuberosum]|nr:hypothetical protein KY289_018311 [Solanum tuberosum]